MLTLPAILRLLQGGLIIASVIAAVTGFLWFVDKMMDIREAQVHADYAAAIETANRATDEDAAESTALNEKLIKLRTTAVAAYQAKLKGKCPLSADEATKLGSIR
jgi:hypothetical protein